MEIWQLNARPEAETETDAARAAAVAAAMADIRKIEAEQGVTRAGVAAIRERLLALTANRRLFPPDAYPPPGPEERSNSRLYLLAQDADDRFALYAQSSAGLVSAPVHNHGTWAVIVGFVGSELNRFYRRLNDESGSDVEEVGHYLVESGTGVAMLGDDLHSIHIDEPALNFHCYGLALERLDSRRYFNERERRWKPFGTVGDIVDVR